jgi:hypothetical protein
VGLFRVSLRLDYFLIGSENKCGGEVG